ncbi:class I SAM-dependent methyltransferase [Brachyspira murdochii]|uniref:class I SAM-dependent methyltransferase n=1 Tax=Brachyspira murdochii TaxID=84378 RepID=UPI0012F48B77|nr:class I SAM-dependent methyltransferase [Brachyspira murdochii]
MDINVLYDKKYEIVGKKYYNDIFKYQSEYTSLMSTVQLAFLMAFIEDNNINNVLEIGVFNGVSSLAILKSGLKNNNNFNLYSIDLNVVNNEDFIGQAVKEICTEDEKKHYHLFVNKTSFDIEQLISNHIKFDLVFIDGKHSHPGPLLDLLFALPYLNNNAFVFFHDIVDYNVPGDFGSSYVFECWNNLKYRIYDYENNIFSNMGGIQIHSDNNKLLDNLISISQIPFESDPWTSNIYNNLDNTFDNYENRKYCIGIDMYDLDKLENYLNKNYNNTNFTNKIMSIFKENYNNYMKNWISNIHNTRASFFLYKNIENINDKLHSLNVNINENAINDLYNKFNKLVNSIAWWIPVKKWRDNFRNKILYGESRAEQSRAEQSRAEQSRVILQYV